MAWTYDFEDGKSKPQKLWKSASVMKKIAGIFSLVAVLILAVSASAERPLESNGDNVGIIVTDTTTYKVVQKNGSNNVFLSLVTTDGKYMEKKFEGDIEELKKNNKIIDWGLNRKYPKISPVTSDAKQSVILEDLNQMKSLKKLVHTISKNHGKVVYDTNNKKYVVESDQNIDVPKRQLQEFGKHFYDFPEKIDNLLNYAHNMATIYSDLKNDFEQGDIIVERITDHQYPTDVTIAEPVEKTTETTTTTNQQNDSNTRLQKISVFKLILNFLFFPFIWLFKKLFKKKSILHEPYFRLADAPYKMFSGIETTCKEARGILSKKLVNNAEPVNVNNQ